MKVSLDLDLLLKEGEITQAEHDKLSRLAARSTGSLAFNILIGFGVVAVSGAALALAPVPTTAMVIGLSILVAGLVLLRSGRKQWVVLSNICILVGALMTGGGIVTEFEGSRSAFLSVTAIYAMAGIFANSALLAVLATLSLSAAVGARTGYFHASYFISIQEPLITIILFSVLAGLLHQLSKILTPDNARLATVSARTGVFLVNMGFWVGSLWGDHTDAGEVIISDTLFAILWAVALLTVAAWSWQSNRRWVLNTTATFGGIHFYTQWFENLGATPGSVLAAGLLALGFALGLRSINSRMRD